MKSSSETNNKHKKKKNNEEENQDDEVVVVETSDGGVSIWHIGLGVLALGGIAAAAGGGGGSSSTPKEPINIELSGMNQWSSIGGWGEIDVLAGLNMTLGLDLLDIEPTTSMYWGFSRANFNDAHSYGYTGEGVVVAVIDSGLDVTNLDLTQNLSPYGYNFITNNTNIADDDGHGTAVSSIIAAANDGVSLTGGAYGVELMPLKVLDATGQGNLGDIVDAIYYAVDHGADIINLSLGGDIGDSFDEIIPALQYADDNSVLVVIAAGNESHYEPTSPAYYAIYSDSILAVGSTKEYNGGIIMSPYSNHAGSDTPYGFVLASGCESEVYSLDGQIVLASGTSMATAYVTSQAAILLSADPTLSDEQLVHFITSSASTIVV